MTDQENEVKEYVERRVRDAQGRKALREVRGLVDELKSEEEDQYRLQKVVLVIVALLMGIALLVVLWPPAGRFVSGLL